MDIHANDALRWAKVRGKGGERASRSLRDIVFVQIECGVGGLQQCSVIGEPVQGFDVTIKTVDWYNVGMVIV